MLEVINHIACDCTDDPSNPPVCYNGTFFTISVLNNSLLML